MIERYTNKAISKIWSDKNKYETWLKVEQLICEAWSELGIIDKSEIKMINNKTFFDEKRMLEIEIETKHDVVAFTRMLSEQLGKESRWIHLGITSTDIVDTAQNYLIKQSNEVVFDNLNRLLKTLKEKALDNKDILIMGRSHGMFGEPTSLGLKFALWYEEIIRQLERFELARRQIELAKVSGSMGNYANLELEVEEYVADKLNLRIDNLSTQVTQRDRHAFLLSVFANIASTLEKITTEIRLFQRSDVNEMAEGFAKGQKGSSSMPHKKNPISSENITGLSRMIKSYAPIAFENNILWHERDISHSSNERIILPDVYNLLTYTLKRLINTIDNLVINYDNIQKHIDEAKNIYFSQRVLTYTIIKNKEITREVIYDLIQSCSLEAMKYNLDFKEVIINSEIIKYLDKKELEKLFDLNFFNRQTNKIFKRIFI